MILDAKPENRILELDAESLDPSDLSMGALMREINLRRRPPVLLRYMMNALENKRQKKLLGWSRPWNKKGMTVFRSHGHEAGQDAVFMEYLQSVFWRSCPDLPSPFRGFAESLWADPARMAFTFFHNDEDAGNEYEGLTLSLGRKVPGDKTKRDRIDFILEDLRTSEGVDQQPDRVRIIVNPFSEWAEGRLWAREWTGREQASDFKDLYSEALGMYRQHRDDPDRQWNHWAFRYIEYFGPRSFIPRGSAFT